jgi:hypothetical protein
MNRGFRTVARAFRTDRSGESKLTHDLHGGGYTVCLPFKERRT